MAAPKHFEVSKEANTEKGIFSMVIMPKQANWEAYALLLIFLAFLTLAIAFRSHAMKATAMGSWQWLKRAVTERF